MGSRNQLLLCATSTCRPRIGQARGRFQVASSSGIQVPSTPPRYLSRLLRTRLRAAHRLPNHFACATCPADVLARVVNRNCQIVATAVMTGVRARRAPGHIIPANFPEFCADVIEDSELRPARARPELTV